MDSMNDRGFETGGLNSGESSISMLNFRNLQQKSFYQLREVER